MPSCRVIGWLSLVSAVALTGASATSAAASVLLVGDSLGVGTEPALRAALPSVAIDADVQNGRFSTEGVSVLESTLGPDHETVVFDLGTNDGPRGVDATARSLAAARDLADGRCLVVATLNHPPVGGFSIDTQNAMIRNFVASTPNAALVDWHGAAQAAGMLRSDGVHATSAGYALRGVLFAEAIQGCLSVGSAGAPAVRGPSASTTKRSAQRRRREPPPPPPWDVRLVSTLKSWMATAAPRGLASRAGSLVGDASASLVAVLTPRGPEPVLGASDDAL